jgi:uncharacterized damage-inducible protein DinB
METDFGPVCRQHLEFMKWAVDRFLAALEQVPQDSLVRDLGNSFQSLFGTLNHVYLAELVWLRRVTDEPNALIGNQPVPPDLSALAEAWPGLHRKWIDWSHSFTSEDWARPLVYSNQPGAESRVPFWQIVMHVTNHGSYHRGQVATLLRQSGIKPPGTDLITYYKSLQ